jgi:hypothetical protein
MTSRYRCTTVPRQEPVPLCAEQGQQRAIAGHQLPNTNTQHIQGTAGCGHYNKTNRISNDRDRMFRKDGKFPYHKNILKTSTQKEMWEIPRQETSFNI